MACNPLHNKPKALKDLEAPEFISFPNNVVDTCGSRFDFGTPVAQDNSGKVHLSFMDSNKGDCDQGLVITRIWSAVDKAGNQKTRKQRIQLLASNKNNQDLIFDDQLYLNLKGNKERVELKTLLQSAQKVSIRISDLAGTEMYQQERMFSKGQLLELVDISDFPKGTYFVMLQYDGKWLSGQFVVN